MPKNLSDASDKKPRPVPQATHRSLPDSEGTLRPCLTLKLANLQSAESCTERFVLNRTAGRLLDRLQRQDLWPSF